MITGFLRGRVTPVLGAGVNLCGRAPTETKQWLGHIPPSAGELASYLAVQFKYPRDQPVDLLRVSQFIYAVRGGSGPLYDVLHDVFDNAFPTTAVHEMLAGLLVTLRSRATSGKPPVILTTNYDDLTEAALRARGEPFDLIVYVAEGRFEGRFCSCDADGRLELIADPKTNIDIDPDRRPVILKMHGFVDRHHGGDDNDDSYVITEDHYIEYLTAWTSNVIPVTLGRPAQCHFLFLGYSLPDWNLRVILHRSGATAAATHWWAIQRDPDRARAPFLAPPRRRHPRCRRSTTTSTDWPAASRRCPRE